MINLAVLSNKKLILIIKILQLNPLLKEVDMKNLLHQSSMQQPTNNKPINNQVL